MIKVIYSLVISSLFAMIFQACTRNDCINLGYEPLPADSLRQINYTGYDTIKFLSIDSIENIVDTLVFYGVGYEYERRNVTINSCSEGGGSYIESETVKYTFYNKDNSRKLNIEYSAKPEDDSYSNVLISSAMQGSPKYRFYANKAGWHGSGNITVLGKQYNKVRTTKGDQFSDGLEVFYNNPHGVVKVVCKGFYKKNFVWLRIPN